MCCKKLRPWRIALWACLLYHAGTVCLNIMRPSKCVCTVWEWLCLVSLNPHISNPLSLCLTKKPRLALARFAQAITVQFLFPCLPSINFLNSHLHPLSPIWGPTSVMLWLWQTFFFDDSDKLFLCSNCFSNSYFQHEKKKKKNPKFYIKNKKIHYFNSSLKYWGLTLPDQTGTVAEVKYIETATKPYINSGSWLTFVCGF